MNDPLPMTAALKPVAAHWIEDRPWGSFEILIDEPHTKVKRLTVKPGQRLSLQLHHQRQEHWIVTQGNPVVVLEDAQQAHQPGDMIFIPKATKHRIINPTDQTVELIEVQLGAYFGEDDIVRFEDDYQRV